MFSHEFSALSPAPPPSAAQSSAADNAICNKRKRRPAGTPDPDAEVVSLSPRTLMESDRYVCEICGQGFQRDQNLQMHRRRHKVPWKLLKREPGVAGEAAAARKRVYVCPEPTCLHHDPCHALGDLVGIKKHFRRKHSAHKQWVCGRCSKGYAVQSDYKAHLKTCGTRGHSCDCGRVFSRVESFIEHQDACAAGRARAELQAPQPACLSRTASSPSPSSETNFSAAAATWSTLRIPAACGAAAVFFHGDPTPSPSNHRGHIGNLELQLLPHVSNPQPPSHLPSSTLSPTSDEAHATKLQLSIGPGGGGDEPMQASSVLIKDQDSRVQLKMVEEAREQAKRQIELAEEEFANAKRIRQQAQAELRKAYILKDQATKQINSILLQITCQACRKQFRSKASTAIDDGSLAAASHMSSVITGGDGEDDDNRHHDHDHDQLKNSNM